MRTHSQIVQDAGVPKLRELLGARGFQLSDPTVRSWGRRSIPPAYWAALADAKIATLQELAEAARAAALAKPSEAA